MAKSRKTKIALIQMRCVDDAQANLKKAIRNVEKAAKRGAQIVCLPELFLGPYFCQSRNDRSAFTRTEPVPGPTTEALGSLAKRLGIVIVGGSIFERSEEGRYFNTAPVLGPTGRLLGAHRKVHIPEDFLFHEQHYFEPGDTGIDVYATPFGKIAVLICFDQWFPEAARMATLKGAEILFYPTAIGLIDEKVEKNITGDWEGMWRNVQLGHSAANSVFVAAVNRVGREGAIKFWGGSFISDPSSRLIAKAKAKEQIIMATCDLNRVRELQEAWGFLRNRRPETYGPLTRSKS